MPRNITLEMIELMGLSEYDYMGYKLDKENAQYHHIVKREHQGQTTYTNGAILNPDSHIFLHIIEYKDHNIYELINRVFILMNNRGYIIDKDYQTINALLTMFELKHSQDTNAKGKVLIRDNWKVRNFNGNKK